MYIQMHALGKESCVVHVCGCSAAVADSGTLLRELPGACAYEALESCD